MLVVSRMPGEKILIGNDIEVVLVQVRGDKVRLGIVAPKDVEIFRDDSRSKKIRSTSEKLRDNC